MIQALISSLTLLLLLSSALHARPNAAADIAEENKLELIAQVNGQASKGAKAFTGKVAGSHVRLRLEANLESPIIKELSKDEMLLIDGEENGFYAVVPSADTKAYIFRTYVLDNVVEGSNVNVRLFPSREGIVLGQLNTGDKVDGKISSVNNKWLEIKAPQDLRFYIAREYVQEAGGPDLIAKIHERKNKLQHLLNAATLFAQSEMNKPFEQIDADRLRESFEEIVRNYQDFPHYVQRAKEALDLVSETYLQKKVAFLESKTMISSENWSNKNLRLEEQILDYQKKLANLENEIERDLGLQPSQPSLDADNKAKNADQNTNANAQVNVQDEQNTKALAFPTTELSIPAQNTKAGENIDTFQDAPLGLLQNNSFDAEALYTQAQLAAMTDKMLLWDPIEKSYYHKWSAENSKKTIEDFLTEEKLNAVSLSGIVEPFSRQVKNKPGDYLLKQDNKTVAYLYSTKVNLQDKVGSQVTLHLSPRPNNHFAFPAYHVISAE